MNTYDDEDDDAGPLCINIQNLLLQEGRQRPDKLLLVDVFYCNTTAWHLWGRKRWFY